LPDRGLLALVLNSPSPADAGLGPQGGRGLRGSKRLIHFLVWIVVSGFAGFVASKIVNKSGSGLFMDIVLGIIGGFVGGFIVNHIPALSGLGGQGGTTGFVIEVIVAILGAALVIWLWNMLFRRGTA
jgi:uncharacterized membrane protein YeaQ/YmgE (transglycosylase-associated protein family)